MHATASLQPITWNRVSATSSLVIVEPSLEHDVHSRPASVDLVACHQHLSARAPSPPHPHTPTAIHLTTQGGDLKETKRPPTSLVRGSRGTDVARLQLVYIILTSPPLACVLTLGTLSLPRPPSPRPQPTLPSSKGMNINDLPSGSHHISPVLSHDLHTPVPTSRPPPQSLTRPCAHI